MAISTRDPTDMTGQERMQEIAAILAACIHRLSKSEQKQCDNSGLRQKNERVYGHAERQSGES